MKLKINGKREFNDPVAGVIEAGLKSLKPDSTICLENGHWFIDAYFDGFTYKLQYRNGDTFKFYEPSANELNYDTINSAYQKFRTNDFSWMTDIDFVLSEFQQSPEEILLLAESSEPLKSAFLSNRPAPESPPEALEELENWCSPEELEQLKNWYLPDTSEITDLLVSQRDEKLALVDCTVCSKLISDKALACPHCGCPCSLGAVDSALTQNNKMPSLPTNLELGGDVSMWSSTNRISGNVSSDDVQSGRSSSARLTIDRCLYGLRIFLDPPGTMIQIHYSQIAQAGYVDAVKVDEKNKSVLGRAALGAVLLGPVGAIVGGISGTSKRKTNIGGLYINYWDIEKKRYDVLSMESKSSHLSAFCTEIQNSAAQFANLHK